MSTDRYAGITDKNLAKQLRADDRAEDRGMHADDRETCYTHKTYVEQCGGDQPGHLAATFGRLLPRRQS